MKRGWIIVLLIISLIILGGCSSEISSDKEELGDSMWYIGETYNIKKWSDWKEKEIPKVYESEDCEYTPKCPRDKYYLDEEECFCRFVGEKDASIPWDGFRSYSCNQELSQWGTALYEGINYVRWLEDGVLEVDVIGNINCAFGIKEHDIKVEDDMITLSYEISRPPPDEPLMACECGHELVYYIKGLEDKDYDIKVIEIY